MLKNGMNNLIKKIDSNKLIHLDTSNITEVDTAIIISNDIITGMTKKLTKNIF